MERALCVGVIVLAAGAAAAAEPVTDDVLSAQIAELNKSALNKLAAKQFDGARKHLRDAEQMAKERGGGLGDALLARIYVNMGALEMIASGNRLYATVLFRRALCRQPDIRPVGPIARLPDVVNLFELVRSRNLEPPECKMVRAARARDPGAREPELSAKIVGLVCPTPDETLAGRDFVVRCAAAASAGVAAVTLRYKPPRSDAYVAMEMRRSPRGWWTAAIPGRAMMGNSIVFYMEGFNAGGVPIVANGAASSPNIALVMSGEGCACD